MSLTDHGDVHVRLLVVGEGEPAQEFYDRLRLAFHRLARQEAASVQCAETWDAARSLSEGERPPSRTVTIAFATRAALADPAAPPPAVAAVFGVADRPDEDLQRTALRRGALGILPPPVFLSTQALREAVQQVIDADGGVQRRRVEDRASGGVFDAYTLRPPPAPPRPHRALVIARHAREFASLQPDSERPQAAEAVTTVGPDAEWRRHARSPDVAVVYVDVEAVDPEAVVGSLDAAQSSRGWCPEVVFVGAPERLLALRPAVALRALARCPRPLDAAPFTDLFATARRTSSYRAWRAAPPHEPPPPAKGDALCAATAARRVDDARDLLAAGADPNAPNRHGLTPLDALVAGAPSADDNAALYHPPPALSGGERQARAGLLRALLATSAPVPPSARRRTPLHLARRADDARALITGGVPPDARNAEGRTPLHTAADRLDADVVRTLLDAGVPVDARDDAGRTPLHAALQSPARVAATPRRLYAPPGHDRSGIMKLSSGRIPTEGRQIETIRTLASAGADINANLPDGTAPLAALIEVVTSYDEPFRAEALDVALSAGADPGALDAAAYGRLAWMLHDHLDLMDDDDEVDEDEASRFVERIRAHAASLHEARFDDLRRAAIVHAGLMEDMATLGALLDEPGPPGASFRYAFFERVRIVGERSSLDPVRGELAAVLGRALGDEGPSYAVHVYAEGLCWSVDEGDLEPTDEFDRRETFFDDDPVSLRVSPDGDLLGESDPDER